jgi:hypothetical protein
MSASVPTRDSGRTRWAGVDAARGLAVLGMIVAHTVPRPGGLSVELVVDGRPSLLFALVAGVSLGLLTGSHSPTPPGYRTADRLAHLIRAAVLFALGALLWLLPHGIAVILDYYGVMFLLMIPLLFLHRAALAVVAAALLVVAPEVRNAFMPTDPARHPVASLTEYLLTGWYPALVWIPILIVGLIASRSGLERRGVRAALMIGGATASVVGYGARFAADAFALPIPAHVVTVKAHAGSVAELLGSGGLAVAILGVLLAVLDDDPLGHDQPGRARRAVRWALDPVRSLGRVALTVYVGHVLVIAVLAPLGGAGRFSAGAGWVILVALVSAGIALGTACDLLHRRGPVEAALSSLARLPRKRFAVRD